jgi:hypothetical protein
VVSGGAFEVRSASMPVSMASRAEALASTREKKLKTRLS